MGHNTEGTGKRRNELRHYIDHDEYQKIDRRDRSVFHDRFRSLIVVLQFELRAKQNTDDYFLYASVTRNKEESMDSYWTLVFARCRAYRDVSTASPGRCLRECGKLN